MRIKVLNKIKNYLSALSKINFKDTVSNIHSCDVLLFCHDVDRGISLNNKAYSPLIDSVKDQFEEAGYSCLSIAHPWSKIIGNAGYGSPIAINRSYFIAKTFSKLSRNFIYKADVKLYERIIKKSNAKVIITIGCSNELCEAARNLEVFHAELLHGIGYTPMPWGWESKDKIHLPQAILSFDEVSTKTFSELEKHGVLIKEIPHPFLSRFQEEKLRKIPTEWLPRKKQSKYKKEILVSLQWGYAPGLDEHDFFKGFLRNGLFYDELKEVILKTQDTVFWRFRFHPVQYRQPDKYKKLFHFMDEFVNENKNCDWKESTYIPLPSLLIQCSGHITMSSMTNYEAAYMGVPTLALCPSLRVGGVYEEFFEDLVEQGYVSKQCVEKSDIIKWVNTVEKKEPLLQNLNIKKDSEDLTSWLLNKTESSQSS